MKATIALIFAALLFCYCNCCNVVGADITIETGETYHYEFIAEVDEYSQAFKTSCESNGHYVVACTMQSEYPYSCVPSQPTEPLMWTCTDIECVISA